MVPLIKDEVAGVGGYRLAADLHGEGAVGVALGLELAVVGGAGEDAVAVGWIEPAVDGEGAGVSREGRGDADQLAVAVEGQTIARIGIADGEDFAHGLGGLSLGIACLEGDVVVARSLGCESGVLGMDSVVALAADMVDLPLPVLGVVDSLVLKDDLVADEDGRGADVKVYVGGRCYGSNLLGNGRCAGGIGNSEGDGVGADVEESG